MPDKDFAESIVRVFNEVGPLVAGDFQVRPTSKGNVARLITAILRSRLRGSVALSAKTSEWNGGIIAFKNFTPSPRFWTNVRTVDLEEDPHDSRAWVCSGVDPDDAVLYVWVVPFSLIADAYDDLPEALDGRRNLKVVAGRAAGAPAWTFDYRTAPTNPVDLTPFHCRLELGDLRAFRDARQADARAGADDSEALLGAGVQPSAADAALGEPESVEEPGSNRIHFGPPGTGKSRQVLDVLTEARVAGRCTTVTFHPEYSYSDFVGSYRPVMTYGYGGDDQYRDSMNEPLGTRGRPAVTYQFVPGPLVRMICRAMLDPTSHHYLIIEEINRGNCAAIFGDLFQLLDRLEDGESVYAVTGEADLMSYVLGRLRDLPASDRRRLDRDGLYLPSNLSIWPPTK